MHRNVVPKKALNDSFRSFVCASQHTKYVSSTTLWCSTYSLENHVTSIRNQHSKFWEHSWATAKWISNNCLNWSGKCIQIFQNHLYNFTQEVIFIYSKNKFIISDTYILFQSSSYYSKHWTPITNFSWWQGLLIVGQYTPKLNSHNFYCRLKSKFHQYLLHNVPRLIRQVDEHDLSIMCPYDVFYSNK
jgi:hypothetical protein